MKKRHSFLKAISAVSGFIALMLVVSCGEPFDYYNPPGDSPDPVYAQIKKVPEFSIFAHGIELVPELTRIIDASGLYTAFIPTDSAFQIYFQKKGIKSIEEIPADELSMLINYHLLFDLRFIYDFWYEQASSRGTLYKPEITRYLTRCKPLTYTVRDTRGRDLFVLTNNKFINVYEKALLSRPGPSGLDYLNDYKLAYGKDMDDVNINASTIVSNPELVDLNAENGALHAITEVIEPPDRLDEVISKSNQTQFFKKVLDKLTLLSPSGSVTADGDSLYDIRFGSLQSTTVPLADENSLFTVFIPPDNVLGPLLETMSEGFGGSFDSIPKATLSLLFLNHIGRGSLWDQDLQKGIRTVATPAKFTQVTNLITSNALASNGMVYYINDVMMPDQFKSVAGPILLNKDYSLFAKAIENAGILESLSNLADNTNLRTVLVVPNEAFAAAGISYEPLKDRFKRNNKTLTNTELKLLFEYHILRGSYDVSDLENRYYETENYLWLESLNGEFFGNETGNILSISKTFDWGANGFVHEVNQILVPPDKSLKTLLISNPDYSSFAKALTDNSLMDQFSVTTSNGKYQTIFIPTNEAMEAFVPTGDYSLIDMLKYHLVETFDQPLFTFGTANGTYQTMLTGKEITVAVNGTNMTINNEAQVIGTANILGISGVIQQVDKILYPPDTK